MVIRISIYGLGSLRMSYGRSLRTVLKGNLKYSFEMDLDEAGKWLFGGETNT